MVGWAAFEDADSLSVLSTDDTEYNPGISEYVLACTGWTLTGEASVECDSLAVTGASLATSDSIGEEANADSPLVFNTEGTESNSGDGDWGMFRLAGIGFAKLGTKDPDGMYWGKMSSV